MCPPQLLRILTSAKVHAAVVASVLAYLPIWLAPTDITPDQKLGLYKTFVYTVAALWVAVIAAWAHEDASAKASGSAPAAERPPFEAPDRSWCGVDSNPFAAQTGANSMKVINRPIVSRSALVLVLLLAAAGCGPCPELAVYREGLHAVDEPLYQAHLQLLRDAVDAHLRTAADLQSVRAGVNAAEQLYQQSKNSPGATTQP